MYKGKISIFAAFEAHLGFLLKLKNCKYLRKDGDTAILSDFFTHRLVQGYSV